jgi:hypothetical protein
VPLWVLACSYAKPRVLMPPRIQQSPNLRDVPCFHQSSHGLLVVNNPTVFHPESDRALVLLQHLFKRFPGFFVIRNGFNQSGHGLLMVNNPAVFHPESDRGLVLFKHLFKRFPGFFVIRKLFTLTFSHCVEGWA